MVNKSTVLVTGGAGYIGSHACVELLEAGYQIIIVDNLANSKVESIRRIKEITAQSLEFYQLDIRDKRALLNVFNEHNIQAVMHFAGLKAVGESCEQPLLYYQNNVYGTLILTEVMAESGVSRLVFSSSATVYGDPEKVPIKEDFPLSATNPYGRSKLMIEDILRDLAVADGICHAEKPWEISLLRYFNPIGAHQSGMIGEDPNGIPNNLMPYISQVGAGKLDILSVFGNDYLTRDGTGIRDYIHVVDLAKGHVRALEAMESDKVAPYGCQVFNLGTGNGYSVLELINAFEKGTGTTVKYKIVARRTGDIAECYADASKAAIELNWKAEKSLDDMVVDTWRWQKNNPQGYK